MKQTWLLSAAALVFSVSVVSAVSTRQTQRPQPAPPVKDMTADEEDKWAADTEALVDKMCVSCHPIADITKARKSWADWSLTVKRMAALGIEADEDQLTAVKLYMTRYYGVVNVNTGSAAELSAVLGLLAKDASTIVEYRKAHGEFADAAALDKVPGIDKAKLAEQPDALRFK